MSSTSGQLAQAYAPDQNPLYPVLGALGWGNLVNLGYYTPLAMPRLLGGLASFQDALVTRSLTLLDVQPGDRVLDVACGTGHTTHRIAEQGAAAVGIDLYPPHLTQAVEQHGHDPRIDFFQADAANLRSTLPPYSQNGTAPPTDGALFDKVHCLEAAFHFGPDGRRSFLEDAYWLLKPGGRLVLVDFAWSTSDPREISAADPGRLVRDTWAFEEFEPVVRYIRHAIDIGYRPCRVLDWTRQVTRRFMMLGSLAARLALTPTGRYTLRRFSPSLGHLTNAQWLAFSSVVSAHVPVQRASRYLALILDKPEEGGAGHVDRARMPAHH